LEKFVTVDKMSRSIVVNGPEFAVNWAQDLVSRLNAVKKPVTRKFQLSNNFFSDVGNLFPDYLKPFVFYDEDSNILIGHGPVEEVSRIQDIVEAIESDTSYDPIAFKLESVDVDTAFELIPEALEKFVTVDKMSRSIVVNGPEFAVNWAQDLVSRLNAVKKPVTRIFQLSNNVLGNAGNLFPDYLKPFVFYDEDSNILVGHGPVEEVSRIQNIVETIDQKTPKKMLSKVFQFDQFSIVDFNKMIPKRLSENVFFDDRTKKLLVIGDQITIDEVEGIFIALNNPVEYDVAVFNYVNFDVKGFEQLIPKEFENYVSFDDNTNSVLVNGPKDVVEFVRKAISATEPLQDQIILEAKIVAFDRDESINFGPEFNWPDIAAGQAFGYDNSGIIRPWEVQFGYTIDQSFTNALNVSLELMSQNSEATIFANPTIVTENGSDAEIRVTTAEYVTVQFRENGSTDVSLEEITTGTILKIKPTVDKDGSITLDLEVSVSDVVARGANNLPVVISRNASNRVKIDNGGTAAVAGLVDARTTGRNAGIPGLRHLPLFGTFGSQTVGSDNTKQVAIFVTARTTNSTDVNVKQKNASTFVQLPSDDAFRKEIKDVFALE
jgi:type II secretory pathway component GspD/PulD (secretin)